MPQPSLAGELEAILLGGQRRFTRAEAAERAGISLDRASQLWRALGFASVGDHERAFTEGDVAALANAATLVNAQLVDADSLQSVTRMVGQSMSRLAEWQSRLLVELVAEHPDAIPDGDLAGFISTLEPVLEQVQSHVWRRQLAAAAQRMLGQGSEPAADVQAVGFVDLAGYTSLSRQLPVAELAEVLEEFESLAADLVAEHRGRIVKTIGDEVLFVSGSAAAAAEIGLGLQERAAASALLPPVRAGLAVGEVLSRFGDVYGPVVNIASRLTSLARVGTVLVDQQLAEALTGDERYRTHRIRPASVRGYHHLYPYRLRRTPNSST